MYYFIQYIRKSPGSEWEGGSLRCLQTTFTPFFQFSSQGSQYGLTPFWPAEQNIFRHLEIFSHLISYFPTLLTVITVVEEIKFLRGGSNWPSVSRWWLPEDVPRPTDFFVHRSVPPGLLDQFVLSVTFGVVGTRHHHPVARLVHSGSEIRSEVLMTPALLCHKDTTQGTKRPVCCVFIA